MTWTKIAPLDDLPQGRGVRVELGETRIALFRIEDEVYAVGDRCSHAEASLSEGPLFDGFVECPRHGSEFNLTDGEPASLPATKPVPVYPTRVDDGILFIDLETTA